MIESLREHVEKIKKLPTIPVVAHEILSIVRDDLVSVNKLENIVRNDPAITAKIMSVANSAFYGARVPSKTLDSAILRIGFNTVKNIALGISLLTVMTNGREQSALDYKRIFNHSVSVGFIAGVLRREFKLEVSDEILINGILHDIGYLILNKYFPETYKKVITTYNLGRPLLESELYILEYTHADIGHWLAGKWNLPSVVMDTILYHHKPSMATKYHKRIAIIHLADYLSAKNVMSPTEGDPQYPFDHAALDILGISENDLEDVKNKIIGASTSDALFA